MVPVAISAFPKMSSRLRQQFNTLGPSIQALQHPPDLHEPDPKPAWWRTQRPTRTHAPAADQGVLPPSNGTARHLPYGRAQLEWCPLDVLGQCLDLTAPPRTKAGTITKKALSLTVTICTYIYIYIDGCVYLYIPCMIP